MRYNVEIVHKEEVEADLSDVLSMASCYNRQIMHHPSIVLYADQVKGQELQVSHTF